MFDVKLIETEIDGVKTKGLRIVIADNYSKFVELHSSQIALIGIIGIDKVTAELVEKTSEKSGEVYKCIELSVGERYKTNVFLDKAEKEIIEFLYCE